MEMKNGNRYDFMYFYILNFRTENPDAPPDEYMYCSTIGLPGLIKGEWQTYFKNAGVKNLATFRERFKKQNFQPERNGFAHLHKDEMSSYTCFRVIIHEDARIEISKMSWERVV